MINELAGHLWWTRIRHGFADIYVFLQAGDAVYRCSQSEDVWRQVAASPNPNGIEFSEPLQKLIARCLTGPDGCKYVFFNDNTAIRIFNPPDEPGMITILSHAATFLNQQKCTLLLEVNEHMPETPIIHA